MSGFQKAVKEKAKLRFAIYGLSGGGKTYTSLRIATGFSTYLNKRIAFIDSERSASLYADVFDFDVLELDKLDIDSYVQAINTAEKNNYEILVIDSLSHAWCELLMEVDAIAKAKYRGNTFAAWNEGTPKQKKLINTIIRFNGHIIVTMRANTEWESSTNDGGKSRPVRVGLKHEQGKNIEYEFSLLGSIDQDHILHIQKDRTSKFQDKLITKPDEEFGIELIKWLETGAEKKQETYTQKTQSRIALIKEGKLSKDGQIIPYNKDTLTRIKNKLNEDLNTKLVSMEEANHIIENILNPLIDKLNKAESK